MSPSEPIRRSSARFLVVATLVLVLLADQASKTWALNSLSDGPVDLFWTLRLRLAFNSGAAFSLGEGFPWVFAALAVIVLVGLGFVALRSTLGRASAVGLGLVAGGAVGNLFDRLLRSHDGAVVDFIDLQWWPVFNLADACLFVGIGLLLLTWGRTGSAAPSEEPERTEGPEAADRAGAL